MKKVILRLAMACILFLVPAHSRAQLSLPTRTPVHCSAQNNDCILSVLGGETAMAVARFGSGGAITGVLGENWTLDQCSASTGDCIFHATFPQSIASWCGLCTDKLSFSGNQFFDVFLLTYTGLWSFDQGNAGTYDFQNSAFADCVNGGSCPYPWTLPIETDAGALIISWLDVNQAGITPVRPGPSYSLEANDGLLFVEDMIAPISGVYIGSFTIRAGASHWLMGIAAYKKM